MSRGQKVAAVVAFLIHGLTTAWAEDLFPTYRDEDWEEEARNGVVSLTSSAGNYSVNLSGFLILGMTLSAAVTTWAYLQTALEKTKNQHNHPQHSYGYYQSQHKKYSPPAYDQGYDNEIYLKEAPQGSNQKQQRRSVYDEQDVSLPEMMASIHRQFDEAEIREVSCRQKVICEASNAKGLFTAPTFGSVISNYFTSIESSDWLKAQAEGDKWAKIYFSAWNQGQKGVKSCKAIFTQCSLTPDSINNILNRA